MTCETDGFDPEVEILKTPPAALELAKLRSPHGPRYPSCYRRLWLFSDEARALGERILLLDVDLVVTGDLTSLVYRDEDFEGWKPSTVCGSRRIRLAGGTWLLRTGTRTCVYDDFKGAASIAKASSAGYGGSDQAWISYCLADEAASWRDGLASVRDTHGNLAPGAAIMHFNGPVKPWNSTEQWVRDAWR
jgi:hypothetical protein